MAEDPGHKAMLYFLEVLMNSNGPLSISQMAGRFGSRAFSTEMRLAAGGNEMGLRKFLLRYPSLFTVNGNLVSLNDGQGPQGPTSSSTSSGDSPPPQSSPNIARTVTDLSAETEAVLYFQNKLAKKEEKWVPIKSLAGHLSQASSDIRACVGPQNEFKKFLAKHPHVFEVQGELCSLRDSFSSAAYSKKALESMANNNKSVAARPRNLKFASRSQSNPIAHVKTPTAAATAPTPTTPNSQSGKPGPLTMTANEYKAVTFLKNIIEKKGSPVQLHNLTGHFSQAPESVRNTIGSSKGELEEFVRKNSAIFTVDEDEEVDVKKTPKLHVIITGSRPLSQNIQTLTGKKGKVFHVAKLWGIIDLGKHEHVFFDKSIYHREIDDFQKEFSVNEVLCFNAIMAPKESRAKWRATHVWREHESPPDGVNMSLYASARGQAGLESPANSIEDELSHLLTHEMDIDFMKKMKDDPFEDAITPGSEVQEWNPKPPRGRSKSASACNELPTVAMVPEDYVVYSSSQDNTGSNHVVPMPEHKEDKKERRKSYPVGNLNKTIPEVVTQNGDDTNIREGPHGKLVADASCQTLSTGEVLATQLWHDGSVS